MSIAPDKRMHLIGGALFAAGALFIILVAIHVGIGLAIGIASIVIGWAVERYQAIRREGTPSRADWVATSLPGVLVGAAISLFEWWPG